MTLLQTVDGPERLRGLDAAELSELAAEIRAFLVEHVTRTGGHLGPNLGVVELTIALHRVFDSPRDRLVWDTGHQAYVHKILTGRQAGFARLRQAGGLSGYPSRAESEHDLVENSHASTALSYADGLARAAALQGRTDRAVVAVIGDGALTGGMAWEALNNIGGGPDRPLVVVLNDNGRSYAPTGGGLAEHLAALRSGRLSGPGVFGQFGLDYVGPVDGHDIAAVEDALRTARRRGGPVVVHVVTDKGRGFVHAENNELDRGHAIRPMDPRTGEPRKPSSGPSFTSVFGREIVRLAAERPELVAITASMLEPTGLLEMARRMPDRVIDVGIAEQHAVTMAAGLSMGGLHPVVAIYSTFLNRAFDQVLMDVALHRRPVTFVLDRAGVTGDDGASHNGMWDLSILQVVPGLRIAAPRDGARLAELLGEAVAWREGPTLLRFPKGATGPDVPAVATFGGLDVLRRTGSLDLLVVSVGAMAKVALGVAERLGDQGVGTTVVDPRWVTPVNPTLCDVARRHRLVITIEDSGRTGGVGTAVAQALRDAGVGTPLREFGIPRRFLAHGSRAEVLAGCGLTEQDIALAVTEEFARLESGGQGAGELERLAGRQGEEDER
ncbi:1-deoxy-D-xylulose-5-phosphate synthase [Thermomonospora cellulosilytica]|uniref:1-deoxy-D-xylulose-5-phosphate synthase n=1 Tax=Thermomonospora cellulosilytica TaxID=1411118 RepID=A0A7W3MWG2_9ACTN|nr:1-deoxy-D-xylulose-5-phosphate synthase [Thermomonospora cellulosilytica]MBA9003156.1 1-deoxy-D-xylulose-5-phosphate synthase [Thermomonospora cellulosilytica]